MLLRRGFVERGYAHVCIEFGGDGGLTTGRGSLHKQTERGRIGLVVGWKEYARRVMHTCAWRVAIKMLVGEWGKIFGLGF